MSFQIIKFKIPILTNFQPEQRIILFKTGKSQFIF